VPADDVHSIGRPSRAIRETWGRYAPSFAAEGAGAEDRDSLRRLVELCDLGPGTLVLDVATGAGYTAFAFARAGMRLIPSDPTHEMLLAARQGWTERSLPGEAVCVECWAEALPFADRSLEAVVAHRAPHQFSDLDAFLTEAHRVLVDGGTLGVADQSPPDGFEDWHDELERERDPTHEHARSPRQWRAAVEGAGLELVDSDVGFQAPHHAARLDRVSTPEERRESVRRRFAEIPEAIREVYRPETVEGRVRFRTPQHVLVARPRR
jgi:SAM-dependent methyltransferase